MTILIMFIAISMTVALIFLGIFIWSFKSGQYDDTYTPSIRMLFDATKKEKQKKDENA
jgi:cbb3-type cytochrome oxidase maturation protein